MEQRVFERFRDIIYRESGIVLPPEKLPLLQNRIQKRLKALKIASEGEYLNIIEVDVSGEELIHLIDAISTNVTHFYREAGHFETLRTLLASWKNKKNEVRIWCAAASSGEEPYTIAFEASEAIDQRNCSFKILATDICTKVLETAVEGVYTDKCVSTVPQAIKTKYMSKQVSNDETFWKVKPEIASHLVFKKLNLVKFPYPLNGPIDIIFCRNVMIYFDKPTRTRIIAEFTRLLAPGGYLILSHSENLLGIENNLEKMGASVFQKILK